MADYEAFNKTDWFIQKLSSGWFSRREIIELAAKEFPSVSRKTLEGTIGQYWSDCVNPKWWTNQNIQKHGLKVAESGRRRHIERSTRVAQTGTAANRGGRGQSGEPPNQRAWGEGRDALVQFLEDLKIILTHVVKDRIVVDPTKLMTPDPLFLANLNDATNSINQVIKDLNEDKTGER